MNQKVMVIGLDGATWTLLEPWILSSKLPTFKKLIDFGSRGILESTIPCNTCPAIPSLLTGMNPGNTGIFSMVRSNGSPATLQDAKYPTIWNILDKYNYSSCIANIRFAFPPEKLNGVMICGHPIPSDKSNYTYPADLREKIEGFRDDRTEEKILALRSKKRSKKHREELLELLMAQTETRYKIFKKLNLERDYDFSIFWVCATDTLQHCCWEYKDTLLRLYLKIDSILNDVRLSFPDKNLFIISDHGFESSPPKFFFVNTWLRKEGYLKPIGGPLLHYILNSAQMFAYNHIKPLRLMKILQLLKVNKNKSNDIRRLTLEKLNYFPGIDKKNSEAYLSTLFGININNFCQNETLREEIIRKLENLRDANGERVIKGAWMKEEIFLGRYLDEIPDIIFLTSEKYMPFPTLTRDVFGQIRNNSARWKSGGHSRARDGILIACGPVIARKKDLENVRLEDIVPTVLHLMGCEVPGHVNGKVLTGLFKRNSDPSKRRPLYKVYDITKERRRLERREEEEMKDRLRKLGYL